MPSRRAEAFALVVGAGALTLAASPSARGYTTSPSQYRADVRFVATYSGSGRYETSYRATPPNDGGAPDRNFVDDSSTQRWALKFAREIRIRSCDATPGACASITGVDGARGRTRVTGKISHRHIDGLYKNQNQTVRCRIASATGRHRLLTASVRLRYLPDRRSFAVSTTNPVATPLIELLPACPNQGDPIERILNDYATPGWSFDLAYGADRWFSSRTVMIPAAVFHRSRVIRIRLADTRAGTPPRDCAVEHPSYERCSTGGSWSGVLTFSRR
jgi:hypothetical protein